MDNIVILWLYLIGILSLFTISGGLVKIYGWYEYKKCKARYFNYR
jgi:hypothetical protein